MVLSDLKTDTADSNYPIYRWHEEPSGTVWVLSRTIGWASEACIRCGADSETRIPDVLIDAGNILMGTLR